jgi:hypothetical protein
VEGMTVEERDTLLTLLKQLGSKPIWNKTEHQEYHSALLKVGWVYDYADFSDKWWRWEKVYVPPYSKKEGS